MLTFRQLLDTHRTLLLIDSASTSVQVALLRHGAEPIWSVSSGEAGEQVFAGVEDVLSRAQKQIGEVDAFIYCDGPGSILGIRTTAVALRTWRVLHDRPVYAYCGLGVVANGFVLDGQQNFSVIADARRDSWHCVAVDEAGTISPLHRIPTAALAGDLFMPEGFRHWSAPPAPVQTTPYSLDGLLPKIADVELFDPTAEPDAFLHEEPVYQTWTPRVHRAPTPS
jgi:tRNA threonylcarbamoyladenosine biosynthesis protein TsaB